MRGKGLKVFRSRFFWKVYAAFALLFLANSIVVGVVVNDRVKSSVHTLLRDSLEDGTAFLTPYARTLLAGGGAPAAPAGVRPDSAVASMAGMASLRITVIDAKGRIVADSGHDPSDMDNHLGRPEIAQAMSTGIGASERQSGTMHTGMMYVARSVLDGDGAPLGAVRLALDMETVRHSLGTLQLTLAVVACAGIALALAVGWSLARRTAVPLAEIVDVAESLRSGDYGRKVVNLPDDEIGRLGAILNRLGADLAAKIAELQRLETVRRDFVANVSHEIKTPLTSIRGYVETLLSGALDDAANRRRFLEKIDRNASRLANLVQDILSLARIEATEDTFRTQPVDWVPVIQSVVTRHEDSLHKKHLTLRVQVPASLKVLGDKEAMIQVVDNLLTNAIKYTPDGGSVTVLATENAHQGCLEVRDTGIGIQPEHLNRIFERFYRVDKARSRDLGGTGLGLSIVKHLVSAMHGEVAVESEVGRGSRFIVRLGMAETTA